jgi:peptidoglycan-associated lipoprotein
MKKINPLLVISLCAIFLLSCGSGTIKKAQRKISLYDYSSAIDILKKTADQNDPKTVKKASLLLAECYMKQNNTEQARLWYGKTVQLGSPDAQTCFSYATVLRSTGDYELAKKFYLKFDSLSPKDPRGKILAGYCDTAKVWQKKDPVYQVKNCEGLNSPVSEFGTVFSGNNVCFTSDRALPGGKKDIYGWTGNNYLKIYYADLKNPSDLFQEFNVPYLEKDKLNTEYHNGPATFDGTNSEIFFTRTFRMKKPAEPIDVKEDLLKIFYSKKEGNAWSKPEPFEYNSENYSVGHPSLTADGKTMYFVSDMPGGIGETDIYVTSLDPDGKWSKPVNLGSKINTFGNEMFPNISQDGALYFASDGLPGFGSLDIFVSKKVNGEWTTPVNLGKNINSSYDDFSVAPYKTDSTGLFCSNRPGGKGLDDIYSFRPVPPVIPHYFVRGCVKDKVSHEPIPGAKVFLLNQKEGKVLVIDADNTGCFRAEISLGYEYLAKGMKPGYIADCEQFKFGTEEKMTDLSMPRELLLDKLAVNRIFKLDNIYYDFDKWNIRPDAEPSLNALIKIMKENNITVELGSHTDCRGSDQYNQKLSQRRAESAVNYIVQHGINASRITAKGYGESKPVNKCVNGVKCTEAQHQDNRRTEFKIISSEVQPAETFDHGKYKGGETIEVKSLPDDFFKECK